MATVRELRDVLALLPDDMLVHVGTDNVLVINGVEQGGYLTHLDTVDVQERSVRLTGSIGFDGPVEKPLNVFTPL